MCNTATGSRSSACARTQTNSEHSSMLLMKLCNCRFIVVAIYVSNFKHGFIREYWCCIIIGLFLLAVLHISGSIVFSCSTAVDSTDHHCLDCPKNNHDILESVTLSFSTAWPETSTSTELPIVTSTIGNIGSYTMTQLIQYTNIWLFWVAS